MLLNKVLSMTAFRDQFKKLQEFSFFLVAFLHIKGGSPFGGPGSGILEPGSWIPGSGPLDTRNFAFLF